MDTELREPIVVGLLTVMLCLQPSALNGAIRILPHRKLTFAFALKEQFNIELQITQKVVERPSYQHQSFPRSKEKKKKKKKKKKKEKLVHIRDTNSPHLLHYRHHHGHHHHHHQQNIPHLPKPSPPPTPNAQDLHNSPQRQLWPRLKRPLTSRHIRALNIIQLRTSHVRKDTVFRSPRV